MDIGIEMYVKIENQETGKKTDILNVHINNYGIIGNIKTGDRNGDYVMSILIGLIIIMESKNVV